VSHKIQVSHRNVCVLLCRRRQEAQKQRLEQAKQTATELSRYHCPDFPLMPYKVSHVYCTYVEYKMWQFLSAEKISATSVSRYTAYEPHCGVSCDVNMLDSSADENAAAALLLLRNSVGTTDETFGYDLA